MVVRQYRKKPVIIDAFHFTVGSSSKALHDFMGVDDKWGIDENNNVYIVTLEGTMLAKIGDYIIKGVHGEYYPCKPDIFRATYEIVQ